jgi:KDO2-lipid IV(A) lauroyltransferase
VVPFFAQRKENGSYQLEILPELQNFPSDSEQADTNRLNLLIEDAVRKAPEQYLWIHRRYRDTPQGDSHYPA